ncbi:type III-B CRISPR-associated protein Cas10/Cmr2 [Hydrogenobacter sp. Uz 6-8]|jgi:CRISPR-associated protein Cmr2|uniref:type III-B CRISPR-associated protein Cas10/Cmr2 n=1 Tax=Hydrogenobacter sp. Uz 6-8 TaxID=3384828 RepID=UPI0038FC5438
MNKLLLFTFSPVQSFISQSRKLSDLFSSSFILSYLTERLVKEIESQKLGEVIYPVYDESLRDTDLAGYPNRLVVKTEKDLCDRLKELFERVWEELCEHAVFALGLSGRERLQFEKHTGGYFQSFCYCMDYIGREGWLERMGLNEVADAEDYGYTYDLLERYLGALKSFRPYEGKVDEETFENKYPDGCTLCGERPALALDWDELGKRKRFMLGKGEKLCGVCLTKRFAMEYFEGQNRLKRKSFPSTKDLAWARLRCELMRDSNAGRYLEYIRAVEQAVCLIQGKMDCSIKDINADWLDPEDVLKMKKEAQEQEEELYGELLTALENLYDPHRGGYRKPDNSYFGILMADGDDMGVWLGLSQDKRGKKLSEEFHRNFSRRLSEYAREVYSLARENSPFVELVYAGGDDVLAVGYPTSLLSFAKCIRDMFSEVMGSEEATISAGFVIGHENENLRFLLEEVRNAEKEAKKAGKNRICISVVPRNSQPVRLVLQWNHLGLFERIVNYFREGLLSLGIPYAVREELWIFREEKAETQQDLIKALLRRVLRRKSRLKGEVDGLIERIDGAGFLRSVESLESLLYVARFLSKVEAIDEAVCP